MRCEKCSESGCEQMMIVYTNCNRCGKEIYNGSTDVNNWCEECSNRSKICAKCGKVMHKLRRIKERKIYYIC